MSGLTRWVYLWDKSKQVKIAPWSSQKDSKGDDDEAKNEKNKGRLKA